MAKEFGSYVGMLEVAVVLSVFEMEAFEHMEDLLLEIEKTAMTKAIKWCC